MQYELPPAVVPSHLLQGIQPALRVPGRITNQKSLNLYRTSNRRGSWPSIVTTSVGVTRSAVTMLRRCDAICDGAIVRMLGALCGNVERESGHQRPDQR